MSSTFKNRIPKRKYRERAQPNNRSHLGLLEKKQDYKQRAKHYHKKQDMINNLKMKASLKNED
jgi:U3 small nucleolar RNA-associated protein 11